VDGERPPVPAETGLLVLHAGQIVLADWRGNVLPKEPNKRRSAAVVGMTGYSRRLARMPFWCR
jgi:hypothetical protein